MRHWIVFVLATQVFTVFAGCASRNIYRNVAITDPPLKHGYVHVTRQGIMDAGKEPVEFGGPAATEDTVFVASETAGVEALERATFRRKWKFAPTGGVSGKMLIAGNTLYFGANDGHFYALDIDFGKPQWSYETKAPMYSQPTVTRDRIYFITADDVVYCLERSSGKWLWHYRRGNSQLTTIHGNAVPVVQDGNVYAGFSDGYFVALNETDGNLKWERKIHQGVKFTDVDARPLLDGNRIYVPSYDGALYALDRADGRVVWQIDVGSSNPVLTDGKALFVGSSDGHVYSINKETGRVLWKFELDQGTPTNLVQHDTFLAFGSSQQYFYAIHKGDGSLAYRYNAGLRSGFVAAPVQVGQDIYALSNFGNLHVFSWDAISKKQRRL